MRYRILSIFLWLYTMYQPSITISVVIIWIVAFLLMSYKWTYIFPIITLISLIALHYTEGYIYYIFLFLGIMSMFIAAVTVPYGSGPSRDNYSGNDSGAYSGAYCDTSGGGDC